MDAITQAEGFYYAIQRLVEAGCIENREDETMLAFHSGDRWGDVSKRLQWVWGHGDLWSGPTLLTVTQMRDGRFNYVFNIERL